MEKWESGEHGEKYMIREQLNVNELTARRDNF